MDHRPSDLDPYPRVGRDLAALELWEASLERSRQRRRLEAASRSHRQRRKGTSLAVGAAMLAAPVVPAFAGGRRSRGGSGGPRCGSGLSAAADAALDTSSVAAATGGRTQLLRFGDVGPAVTAIQRQVGVAADGIFGPITRAGVERFQRDHGLGVSGVVDARTWAALFNGRVLFYDAPDASRTTPAAPGKGSVRLVVDRHGSAGESSGGGSGDPGASAPSAPTTATPSPAPSSSPAPATAGGCTDGRIVAPVQGTVTGHFGDGRAGHAHAGEDLATASGTPIHAAQCGTVVQSGSEQGYGLMVCVRHAGGVTTCYAHMSRTAATVSQQVAGRAGHRLRRLHGHVHRPARALRGPPRRDGRRPRAVPRRHPDDRRHDGHRSDGGRARHRDLDPPLDDGVDRDLGRVEHPRRGHAGGGDDGPRRAGGGCPGAGGAGRARRAGRRPRPSRPRRCRAGRAGGAGGAGGGGRAGGAAGAGGSRPRPSSSRRRRARAAPAEQPAPVEQARAAPSSPRRPSSPRPSSSPRPRAARAALEQPAPRRAARAGRAARARRAAPRPAEQAAPVEQTQAS